MSRLESLLKGMSNLKASAVCLCAFASLCFAPTSVKGNVELGYNDWDHTTPAWQSYYGWSLLGTPSTGGNTGGWLRITFTNTSVNPGPSWSDIDYTKATNLFAGVWTTNMWVQFDFWQSNVVAGAVDVVWASTNGDIWSYALTPPSGTQTWATLTAPLTTWSDWANIENPFLTSEQQYLADLSSIDWIGVDIFRDTTDQQIYGIDNMQLWIPEPAECAMLAAALITAAMSFRRRRRAKVNGSLPRDSLA